MTKIIDNSWVEGSKYVDLMSLKQSKRWSAPSNVVKAFIAAEGLSDTYNPRHAMVVNSGADTVTVTPSAGTFASSEYWWVTITDGEGNWVQGEVTDLTTPGNVVLSTVGFNYDKPWQTILRARLTGNTVDAVILWPINDPASDPTVTIPAGYGN
jgi:hypothetical protein